MPDHLGTCRELKDFYNLQEGSSEEPLGIIFGKRYKEKGQKQKFGIHLGEGRGIGKRRQTIIVKKK